jgi:hypothetical protein
MKARGKREAMRCASPLESNQKISSPEKGVITSVFRPFRPGYRVLAVPGATRCALAPGFHISRRWRFYYTRSVSTFEAKLLRDKLRPSREKLSL